MGFINFRKHDDHVGRLLEGAEPVAWTFDTIIDPKRKPDLQHLIGLFGHQESAAILKTVLSDARLLKAVRNDFKENDLQYHFLSEDIRALFAFRFFCVGMAHEARSLVDSIRTTAKLENMALFEIYFMLETHLSSGSVTARVTTNPQLLKEMEVTLENMILETNNIPKCKKDHQEAHDEIYNRITSYSPSRIYHSSTELVEIMAGFPHPIPAIRDNALSTYLLSSTVQNAISALTSLNRNVNPQVIYGHRPTSPRSIYLGLIQRFSRNNEDPDNNKLLKEISAFADSYLQLAEPISVKGNEKYLLCRLAKQILTMPYSADQLSMLIELTRLLNPNQKPLAGRHEKPLPRLMALAPLAEIASEISATLKEDLKDYVTTFVKKHQLSQQKIARRVNSSACATLVGHLLSDDLTKNSSESLLTWKLEAELGL